jgi:hypothetical protein
VHPIHKHGKQAHDQRKQERAIPVTTRAIPETRAMPNKNENKKEQFQRQELCPTRTKTRKSSSSDNKSIPATTRAMPNKSNATLQYRKMRA